MHPSAILTIKVPRVLHKEAVIADLIANYGLRVNIVAASLGEKDQGDGWFKLELLGTERQVQSGIKFLHDLGVEIFDHSPLENNEDLW